MAKVRTARDPGMYADGNGLYLRVDSSGSRRWVQRITIRGKRHNLGLSEDTVTVHPQPAVAGAPGSTVGQQNSWVYTFRRDRMETEGIDPYHAKLFKVSGASMDPILPDGATILVDDGLTNLADGGLFLVESDGTLLVKQAQLAPSGWLLTSVNPGWESIPWHDGMEVWGRVRWCGRRFPVT